MKGKTVQNTYITVRLKLDFHTFQPARVIHVIHMSTNYVQSTFHSHVYNTSNLTTSLSRTLSPVCQQHVINGLDVCNSCVLFAKEPQVIRKVLNQAAPSPSDIIVPENLVQFAFKPDNHKYFTRK